MYSTASQVHSQLNIAWILLFFLASVISTAIVTQPEWLWLSMAAMFYLKKILNVFKGFTVFTKWMDMN